MIRHGVSPFLECSTRGDRRFSAFCAMIGGRSIEEIYQSAKVFEDGVDLTWQERRGCKALNADECTALYALLWDTYMDDHPDLLDVLRANTGLSDTFGRKGHCCQATELWRIRNEGKKE